MRQMTSIEGCSIVYFIDAFYLYVSYPKKAPIMFKFRVTVLVAVSALIFLTSAIGQAFKVPDHYSFESIDSYHKYDKDIINCVNWLEKVAPTDVSNNAKRAARFLMEWEIGCPYVQFVQNARIEAFLNDCPEYRVYYVGGWVRYSLQNDGKASKMMCTYAGMKTVLKVYKENRAQKRDANLDELLKLDEQSKLRMWVQEKMS